MTILERATEFANFIKEDELLKNYYAACDAYNNDSKLQAMIQEYQAQRAILGQEFSKATDDQNKALLELVRTRMDELAKQISESQEYRAVSDAQAKVSELMQKVNDELQRVIFGVEPESEECTHDCSTCHAACSSKKND